jgi:hypothetical protein
MRCENGWSRQVERESRIGLSVGFFTKDTSRKMDVLHKRSSSEEGDADL